MSYSIRENDPELLDQLCQAIADQNVPALASEPMMPWEQSRETRTAVAKTGTDTLSYVKPEPVARGMASWRMRGLTLSAVAVAVFVCGFLMTGMLSGNSAFAQVQEALSKIYSVRFRTMDYEGDRDPKVTSIVIVSGVGQRSDSSDGLEVVSDYRNRKRLTLNHRSKAAELVQMFDSPQDLDLLWTAILSAQSENVKKLESGTIDGKKVDRFEVQNNGALIVSVDPTTKLPVRMEMDVTDGKNDKKHLRHVATDFIFNSAVDPSLFSTTPPSEYQLTESLRPNNRKQFAESDLIISPETGIGGVAFGSSKEAVIAKLGQPDSIREKRVPVSQPASFEIPKVNNEDTVVLEMQYPSDGFDLRIGSRGLEGVHCYGKKVRGAMARDFAGKTDTGIKLGVTQADVIAKLGQPDARSSHGELLYVLKGYRFNFMNGTLSSIIVSAPLPENVKVTDQGIGKYEIRSSEK